MNNYIDIISLVILIDIWYYSNINIMIYHMNDNNMNIVIIYHDSIVILIYSNIL